MYLQNLRKKSLTLAIGLGLLLAAGWAQADPPTRAARLGYTQGQVSLSPAGEADWVQASVNRPLTTGDRLWSDANARAELQIGGAAIRLGERTNVSILNLDDNTTQLQLTQGSLKVRIRRIESRQTFEVDTPNLAFTLRRAGEYRIDVDANGEATSVMVQSGEAEAYGDTASYVVRANQGYRFYGTGLSDYETLPARRDDALDRWAHERDRRSDNSATARYVSAEVVGYEDLDANGSWRTDRDYGNVWIPNRVAADWTPYHDGHWAWIDPWGWTWVDDAPWGYAVSHYGRWARINNSWGWVPGPARERAVYAPALVVFLGGQNFQASVSVGGSAGNVGWFPLAPREVYRPAYQVSRGYFDNINHSNAVIAPTVITQVYNTNIAISNVVYVNQRVPGAVVAVPTHAFAQSQAVAKAAVVVAKEVAISAPVAHLAAVAPVVQSVQGGAPDAGAKPPTQDRRVVARTAPPAARIPFQAQQAQLATKPGAPIDEQRLRQIKPAVPAEPPATVNLLGTAKAPPPTSPPPPIAAAGKSPGERKADTNRAVAPATAAPAAAPAVVVEPSKAIAAQAEASKANAARAEADRGAAAQANAARAEAAKTAGAKTEADRAAAAQANAARAEAAKAAGAKAEASRANAERPEGAAPAAAPSEPGAHAAKPQTGPKKDEERQKSEEDPRKR